MPGRALQLLLLALAAACCSMGALAVDCPSLGEVAITGCSECLTVNVTRNSTGGGIQKPGDDDDASDDDDDDEVRPSVNRRSGRNFVREGSSGNGRGRGRNDKGRGKDDKGPKGPCRDNKGRGRGRGRGKGKCDKGKGNKGPGKNNKNSTYSLPTCTACAPGFVLTNDSGNFVLITGDGNTQNYTVIQNDDYKLPVCGCAPPNGTILSGFVNQTYGKKKLSFPQFTCEACPPGQVPLTPESGLTPYYNNVTGTWTLVILNATNTTGSGTVLGTAGVSSAQGNNGVRDRGQGRGRGKGRGRGRDDDDDDDDDDDEDDDHHDDDRGDDHDDDDDRDDDHDDDDRDDDDSPQPGLGLSMPPWFPGSCVECPAGFEADGALCVQRNSTQDPSGV